MIRGNDYTTSTAAFDTRSLDGLRSQAKDNSQESVRAAAKQFEALLLNNMLKSMRQASGQDGIFDSEQTKTFTAMLDQQLSQHMANKGMGLADALVRQLTHQSLQQAVQPENGTQTTQPVGNTLARGIDAYLANRRMETQTSDSQVQTATSGPAHVREFKNRLGAHAEEASRETGIPAKFMLGQAALETGWGKKEIKTVDGTNSHNIFGVKATKDWKGKTVDAVTTEYINGVAQRRVEKFKAYDSYADAFKDYARLLTRNPRYESVIANAKDAVQFAQGLQRAGYATDPNYAAKLTKIIKQTLSA